MNTSRTRVVPANILGNVDHFYHFLFGLFLPFLVSQKKFLLQRSYQFPDLGPMNRHLEWLSELGMNLEVGYQKEIETDGLFEISCAGWDHPSAYQFAEFELARDTLFGLMKFSKPTPNLEPRVLIIERGLALYDHRAKKTTNGVLRRSIPNLSDLCSQLSPFVGLELAILEEVSLKDQIQLFATADIVVAQHGASFANLVWCKPGAWVIEVIDPKPRAPFFKKLAHRLSLNYISIPQANNHAEIDIDSVASIILKKCSEYTNLL